MGTLKEDYYPYQLISAAIDDLRNGVPPTTKELQKVSELTQELYSLVETLLQIQTLRDSLKK
jgi:hypothetical protein